MFYVICALVLVSALWDLVLGMVYLVGGVVLGIAGLAMSLDLRERRSHAAAPIVPIPACGARGVVVGNTLLPYGLRDDGQLGARR